MWCFGLVTVSIHIITGVLNENTTCKIRRNTKIHSKNTPLLVNIVNKMASFNVLYHCRLLNDSVCITNECM